MKLTSSELKQVAAYGLGGTFIASAFHLMSIYKTRREPTQLDVEVESLEADPSLLFHICTLERQINDSLGTTIGIRSSLANEPKLKGYYRRLVTCVDRLLFLKDTLKRSPSEQTGFENIEYGYLQFRRVTDTSRRIVNYVSASLPPERAAEIVITLQKITQKTENHFQNVLFLLRKVPIHLNSLGDRGGRRKTAGNDVAEDGTGYERREKRRAKGGASKGVKRDRRVARGRDGSDTGDVDSSDDNDGKGLP